MGITVKYSVLCYKCMFLELHIYQSCQSCQPCMPCMQPHSACCYTAACIHVYSIRPTCLMLHVFEQSKSYSQMHGTAAISVPCMKQQQRALPDNHCLLGFFPSRDRTQREPRTLQGHSQRAADWAVVGKQRTQQIAPGMCVHVVQACMR